MEKKISKEQMQLLVKMESLQGAIETLEEALESVSNRVGVLTDEVTSQMSKDTGIKEDVLYHILIDPDGYVGEPVTITDGENTILISEETFEMPLNPYK